MKSRNLFLTFFAATLFLITTGLSAQWAELNTGVSYDFKALSIPNPDIVWASGQDGKIIKSMDAGATWMDVSLPVPGGGEHTSWNMFAADAKIALASTIEWANYKAHLFRTSDGGITWTEVLSQEGTMFNNVWIYPDNTAFLVGDQLGDGYWVAYKSTNCGINWTPLVIPCGPAEYGYNNSLFVREGVTYFAGTSWDFNTWTVIGTQVYKSKDLINWEVYDASCEIQPPNISASNSVWFNDVNKGFINGAYTENGGKKWKQIYSPDQTSTILTLVGHQTKLWAITSNSANLNVYLTYNQGRKWTLVYSPEIPNAVNNQLTGPREMPSYAILYLIRSNGTIAKFTEENNEFADENINVKLKQNYPNPFNPSTMIQYQVPQNSMVTLKVYDVLGKEVASLVNETKSSGTYTVEWNASSLPSGVYFAKIKAGSYTDTKKMLLVK